MLEPFARADEIDRYSATSGAGVAVSFLDEANPSAGWKTTFSAAKSWVRFNEVDFGPEAQKMIEVRAKAPRGAVLEVRLDEQDGPLVGRVKVEDGSEWQNASGSSRSTPAGVHDLIVSEVGAGAVDVDWRRFR